MISLGPMIIDGVASAYSPPIRLGRATGVMIAVRALRLVGGSVRLSVYAELSLNGTAFGPIGASPLFYMTVAPETNAVVIGAYEGASGSNAVRLAGNFVRFRFTTSGTGTVGATFEADVEPAVL